MTEEDLFIQDELKLLLILLAKEVLNFNIMVTDNTKNDIKEVSEVNEEVNPSESSQEAKSPDASTETPQGEKRPRRQRGGGGKKERGGRRRNDRTSRPEFDQKIIDIRRVARVVAGGRRFSFSVAVVAGNRNGSVGVGTGKAGDTSLAIDKAYKSAVKKMITFPRTKSNSIPHEVSVKESTSRLTIMPAPGRGIIAGSSVRTVLDLAGVRDIVAKLHSPTKNKLNNARATIKALKQLRTKKR